MAKPKKPARAAPAARSRAGVPSTPSGRGQAPRQRPPQGSAAKTAYGPPPRRPRRVRRKRKGRRTLHYLLLILFVVAAGVVLSLTVFFKIESVQVIGIDRYQPDDIIAASGIQIEDNLLKLDIETIEAQILAEFPYIETVRVHRRFPPRVELSVVQSVPAYAVYLDGEVALLTEAGKLLEVGDLLVPPEIPIIKGLNVEGFSPGEYLGGEDDPDNAERLTMLRYLFDAAKKVGFEEINNVDVTDRLNMTTVYEARLFLMLGSEYDLEYKLTFLREVIADRDIDEQGRIDVSNVRDKRAWFKHGTVEQGVFHPLDETITESLIEESETETSESEEGIVLQN